jgi:hypothetical protein
MERHEIWYEFVSLKLYEFGRKEIGNSKETCQWLCLSQK